MDINLIKDSGNKAGLERTGRCGGNNRHVVDQHKLSEKDVMVPKTVSRPGSLSVRIKLD